MKEPSLLYVGTNRPETPKGVCVCRFDAATGSIELMGTAEDVPRILCLTTHPSKDILYAASAPKDARVHAFRIADDRTSLGFLNARPSEGDTPCYLSVDSTERFLLVANYTGGTAAVFRIGDNGALGEASDVARLQGSGPDPQRQKGPHPHSIVLSPDNRFALVADLGADLVAVFRFDADTGRLIPNDPPGAKTAPGAGPRHLVFHPDGSLVFVVNELNNTVTSFGWDATRGTLSTLQSLSTVPDGFAGESFAAAVLATADGRFLYTSNRGHDSIAVFAIDAASGALERVAVEPALGESPTSLAIDPTVAWLLAANYRSDSVAVFRIESATGRLSPAGPPLSMPAPMSLAFHQASAGLSGGKVAG